MALPWSYLRMPPASTVCSPPSVPRYTVEEGAVTEHEKMEFWQALGRLYDSSLALQRASEALQKISEGHEKRLDRLEVVQQWLAEKERARETGDQP
jgi:hypothetical protein